MSSRIERKKEDTRQKIVDAALRLVKDQGLEATTMEQIAEAADVAKGTLYNYFPVKEAILVEYIRRSFEQKNPERFRRLAQLPDTRARLVSVLSEMMVGVQAQREIFEKFLVYRVQSILTLKKTAGERSGIESLASEIIRLGQESGEMRRDLPPGVLEDQFEFIFVEVAKQYFYAPETFKAQEAIANCVDLFIDGAKSK